MPVSSSLRTLLASKRVHGSQTLREPAPQHFHPNFPLIQDKLSSEPSPLFRSKIIRLFRNTFTADRMYSRHRSEKLSQQVQTLLSQKEKIFYNFYYIFGIYTKFCSF